MRSLPLAGPPRAESCGTCASGCHCTGADAACGHYGCYGRGPVTCPSAQAARAAYEQQLTATRAHRARLAARRSALVGPAYRLPAGLLP